MRLRSVSLNNFGVYRRASVDLAASTVVVGQNDSGKTTLVTAIRSLFHTEAPLPHWDDLKHHSLFDIGDQIEEPTWVVGAFGDLTDIEADIYQVFAKDGVVRCGTIWKEGAEQGLRCVLVDQECAATIDGVVAVLDAEGPATGSWAAVDHNVDDEYIWLASDDITDLLLRGMAKWPKPAPFPKIEFPITTPDHLIHLPGPEVQAPDLRPWLESYLIRSATAKLAKTLAASSDPAAPYEHLASPDPRQRRAARRMLHLLGLGDLLNHVADSLEESFTALSRAYGEAAKHYLADIDGAELIHQPPMLSLEEIVAAAIEDWSVELVTSVERDGDTVYLWHSTDEMGAGARRAAALATLELLRDQDIHHPDDWRIALIEEPEVGLHPSAQRRVARNLAELAGHGIQTVLVTHSPVIIRAAPREALVLAKSDVRIEGEGDDATGWRDGHLSRLADRREALNALGVEPADIVLASAFVVVEGNSDAAILSALSQTNGADLDELGVQIVAAHGSGMAATVTAVLAAVYAELPLVVILDNGSATQSLKLELEQRFGSRVEVRLLDVTEIEGWFHPDAVCRWLSDDRVESIDREEVAAALGKPGRKSALRHLAHRVLNRNYRVVEDGVAIASQMRENEIPATARALLTELAGLGSESQTARARSAPT